MSDASCVLDREYLPSTVIHREDFLEKLVETLEPISDGSQVDPVIITGPSGTGKTCVARHCLRLLRNQGWDVKTQYVNCWEFNKKWKVLSKLLEGIDRHIGIHRQSTPYDVVMERLRDYEGQPYVVVLDEIDELQDRKILYDIYRVNKVVMVLITNNKESVFSGLDERVKSRLSVSNHLIFPKYTPTEIYSILTERMKEIDDELFIEPHLSSIAFAADCDARTAIGGLRNLLNKYPSSNSLEIPEGAVDESIMDIEREPRQKDPDDLSDDERLILDIIGRKALIEPKTIYSIYSDEASDPKSERQVRNYLKKLVNYNLIKKSGYTRNRQYSSALAIQS